MVTPALSVESNVSRGGRSGREAGGAFTSAVEVWDRAWKVLAVSGSQRRSLFKPILSVAAGRRRASEANGGDGSKSMELLETIQRSHSQLCCSVYLSLTPSGYPRLLLSSRTNVRPVSSNRA